MQLKNKISIITSSILITTVLNAEDYVRVNYLQYSESDGRIQVSAPSFELNKDLGVDYTLNVKLISDSVSGATPIYTDSTSSASVNSSKANIISRDNDDGEDDDDDDSISGASSNTTPDSNSGASSKANTSSSSSVPSKNKVEMKEDRIYGDVSLTTRLENRDEITTSFSKSRESDYDSSSFSADYLFYIDSSKNRSLNIGLAYQLNEILIENCSSSNYACEGITSGASAKKDATNISTELGLTQIIDDKSLGKFFIFYGKEEGYLSNPHYNVVRNYNGSTADFEKERRPDIRSSYGFNTKYIRAFTSKLSSNFRYRFYRDDWQITSHTFDINNYYEANEDLILGFGLRYYKQSEAEFFSDSIYHFTDQKYASHDDRLSAFDAKTYKTSIDIKYDEELSFNLSFNLYEQSTGLKATYSSVGLKYSF